MTPEFLPDNDPDLRLARRIGDYLEGNTSSREESSDPLLEVLSAYKQHSQNSNQAPPAPSQALWEYIDRKTRPSESFQIRIFTLDTAKSRAAWTVAAGIVIATLIGIFYLTLPQSPALLAKAGSAIETLTLPDGSEVTLRPYSKLYKLGSSQNVASYRLSGEGFFRVTNNPGRTFSVEAGSGKVSVLGTQFNLSSWGDITQVFLKEGAIQFTHLKSRKSVTLEPGQSVVIAPGVSTLDTSKADAEEFTDWMRIQLVFDNKPADYVFKELEHHFNIKISAPDNISSIPISSGGLTLEHEEASLEYLGLVLGGSFRSTGPGTYTFVANK